MQRVKDTEEARAFWEKAEATAREVATWPAWRRLKDPRDEEWSALERIARLYGEAGDIAREALGVITFGSENRTQSEEP